METRATLLASWAGLSGRGATLLASWAAPDARWFQPQKKGAAIKATGAGRQPRWEPLVATRASGSRSATSEICMSPPMRATAGVGAAIVVLLLLVA